MPSTPRPSSPTPTAERAGRRSGRARRRSSRPDNRLLATAKARPLRPRGPRDLRVRTSPGSCAPPTKAGPGARSSGPKRLKDLEMLTRDHRLRARHARARLADDGSRMDRVARRRHRQGVSLAFSSLSTGYLVAIADPTAGVVLRTTDGGRHWRPQRLSTTLVPRARAIIALSANRAIAGASRARCGQLAVHDHDRRRRGHAHHADPHQPGRPDQRPPEPRAGRRGDRRRRPHVALGEADRDADAERSLQRGLRGRGRVPVVAQWAGDADRAAPGHPCSTSQRSSCILSTECLASSAPSSSRPASCISSSPACTRRSCRATCRPTASSSTRAAWPRSPAARACCTRKTRRAAGWWLIATLRRRLPGQRRDGRARRSASSRIPKPLLWARLPLQGALIAWVWKTAKR